MKKYHCVSDQKGNCYYSPNYDALEEFIKQEKYITSAHYDGTWQINARQMQEVKENIFIKIEC